MVCFDECWVVVKVSRLELIVQAYVSLAKESVLIDCFVTLMDVAKLYGNFIQSKYTFYAICTPITLFFELKL